MNPAKDLPKLQPNTTQIPNVILDEWLPALSGAEVCVVLVIARQTYGWHKETDCISYSQLQTKTGLSRRIISYALQSLKEKGLIGATQQGRLLAYSIRTSANIAPVQKTTRTSANIAPTKETNTKESISNTNVLEGLVVKTSRKTNSFPKQNYDLVLLEYQRLKEIELQGPEYDPVMQTIKSMFLAGRTPEQIIACMKFISEQDYVDWTIRTVKMKLPEILPKVFKVSRSLTSVDPLTAKLMVIHRRQI